MSSLKPNNSVIALSFEHLTQESTTAYKTARITGNTFKTMVQMSIYFIKFQCIYDMMRKTNSYTKFTFSPGLFKSQSLTARLHECRFDNYTVIDNGSKSNNVYK